MLAQVRIKSPSKQQLRHHHHHFPRGASPTLGPGIEGDYFEIKKDEEMLMQKLNSLRSCHNQVVIPPLLPHRRQGAKVTTPSTTAESVNASDEDYDDPERFLENTKHFWECEEALDRQRLEEEKQISGHSNLRNNQAKSTLSSDPSSSPVSVCKFPYYNNHFEVENNYALHHSPIALIQHPPSSSIYHLYQISSPIVATGSTTETFATPQLAKVSGNTPITAKTTNTSKTVKRTHVTKLTTATLEKHNLEQDQLDEQDEALEHEEQNQDQDDQQQQEGRRHGPLMNEKRQKLSALRLKLSPPSSPTSAIQSNTASTSKYINNKNNSTQLKNKLQNLLEKKGSAVARQQQAQTIMNAKRIIRPPTPPSPPESSQEQPQPSQSPDLEEAYQIIRMKRYTISRSSSVDDKVNEQEQEQKEVEEELKVPQQHTFRFHRTNSFSSSIHDEIKQEEAIQTTVALNTVLCEKLQMDTDYQDFLRINNFTAQGDTLLSRILREQSRIQMKKDMLKSADVELYVTVQSSSRSLGREKDIGGGISNSEMMTMMKKKDRKLLFFC